MADLHEMELNKENGETHKGGKQDDQIEEQMQHFHVLAVDDSLIDRKIIEKLLTVSSYQVTCVDSGNKALEYLRLVDDLENTNNNSISCAPTCSCSCISPSPHQELQGSKVNLIITDYSMPGMSGYDLLRKVKGSSWRNIPVVVMSSENVPARINMCLEGGAEEFILKPVQLSDLKKLQSHISKPIIKKNIELSVEEEVEEEDDDEEEENNHENPSKKLLNKRKAVSTDCSERSRHKMEELAVL